MGRRDGVEWLGLGHAGCEPAPVDERGELGQSGRVGVNPFVVDPDAAQRGRSRPGGYRHERPAVTNSVERPETDRGSVQRTVHALGDHATHSRAEGVAAGDEFARTEPTNEPLVTRAGNGDRLQASQGGELEREPAERARGAGDQQGLARVQLEQVERLRRGEGVQRNSRRLDRRRGTWRTGQRVLVEHHIFRLCPHLRAEQVSHADHRLTDGEMLHAGAGRVDAAGQIPADANLAVSDHQARAGQRTGTGRDVNGVYRRSLHLDAYLAGARLRNWKVGDLEDLGPSELADHDCFHGFVSGLIALMLRTIGLLLSVGKKAPKSAYPSWRSAMAAMTAEQRRRQARLAYNAYVAECPSRQVLDAISDKWVTLVLSALAEGPLRYSDLARRIAGVSQKMLTQTLRMLERDGLLTRTITPSVPVRVDYELTPLGETILPVVGAIKQWSEAHIEQIHAARAGYDEHNRS